MAAGALVVEITFFIEGGLLNLKFVAFILHHRLQKVNEEPYGARRNILMQGRLSPPFFTLGGRHYGK